MTEIITVHEHDITVKEYNGQRVITLREIDELHERPTGTAGRNFRLNKRYFIEGEDYYRRNSSEAKNEYDIVAPRGLYLFTQTGYLMIVKSFNDDLSWEIQRTLVNAYFALQAHTEEHFNSFEAGVHNAASGLKDLINHIMTVGSYSDWCFMMNRPLLALCTARNIPNTRAALSKIYTLFNIINGYSITAHKEEAIQNFILQGDMEQAKLLSDTPILKYIYMQRELLETFIKTVNLILKECDITDEDCYLTPLSPQLDKIEVIASTNYNTAYN